jgi:hypothetical protein
MFCYLVILIFRIYKNNKMIIDSFLFIITNVIIKILLELNK